MCVAATTLLVLWFEVARLVLVSVTKAAKLLLRAGEATTGVPTASKKRRLSAAEAIRCREHLPCSIPHVEDELSAVGVELERVDLHAKGGWQQARAAVRSVRGAGVKVQASPERRSGRLPSLCSGCAPQGAARLTDVLLLELSSQVTLDEGRLAHTTITNQHQLANAGNAQGGVPARPSRAGSEGGRGRLCWARDEAWAP